MLRPSAVVGAAGWSVAAVLTAVVVLRLVAWSSGPVTALLLVALPLVLAPAYLIAVVAVVRRDRWLGAAAVTLIAAHVLVVLPGSTATDVPVTAGQAPRLRVVTANLLVGNQRLPEAAAALRRLGADVLVLVELRTDSLATLRRHGLLTELPYSSVDGAPHDVEIFSRLPLRDVERSLAVPQLPQPRAVVDVAGVALRVLGAHPLPPGSGYERAGRTSLAALAAEVRDEDLPVIVAGDLNGDRHFPLFDDLLAEGLRDAAEERGRGLSRTWPQRWPLLALDHVLVRDGAQARLFVTGQREAPLPGSDHLAVVADLAVLERPAAQALLPWGPPVGRRNVLIEGVSGSGKTSVACELERRGHQVVHGDRQLAYAGDPITGEPLTVPTAFPDARSRAAWIHEHLCWPVEVVLRLARDEAEALTVFCGGCRNAGRFLDVFDAVFVLDIDRETLRRRLEERPCDEWAGRGRHAEREVVLRSHETRHDLPEGIRIDATRPLVNVVDDLLGQCEGVRPNAPRFELGAT